MIKEQNIKKQNTEKEEATPLKHQEKREIKFRDKVATFQYMECSYEEANLLYSLIQNTALKVQEENIKSNSKPSDEYLGAQILTTLKCTKEGQEALKNCLKRCILNDIVYEYAISSSANWGFSGACEMLIVETIVNTFQDF